MAKLLACKHIIRWVANNRVEAGVLQSLDCLSRAGAWAVEDFGEFEFPMEEAFFFGDAGAVG